MNHMLTPLIMLLSICQGVKEWTPGETVRRQIEKHSNENSMRDVQKEGSARVPLKMALQATPVLNIEADAGETVRFPCAYPLKEESEMNFIWSFGSATVLQFKNQEIVSQVNRVELVGDASKGNASISFNNVAEQDTGKYICTLTILPEVKEFLCEVNMTVLAPEQSSSPTSPSNTTPEIIPGQRQRWGVLFVTILFLLLAMVVVVVVVVRSRFSRDNSLSI